MGKLLVNLVPVSAGQFLCFGTFLSSFSLALRSVPLILKLAPTSSALVLALPLSSSFGILLSKLFLVQLVAQSDLLCWEQYWFPVVKKKCIISFISKNNFIVTKVLTD